MTISFEMFSRKAAKSAKKSYLLFLFFLLSSGLEKLDERPEVFEGLRVGPFRRYEVFADAELSKNILLTKLNWVLNWSRKSSLFMFQFGLA